MVSHTLLKRVSGSPSSVSSHKSNKTTRKDLSSRFNLSSLFNVTQVVNLCSQLVVVLIVVMWSHYKHNYLEKKILLLSNRIDKQGKEIETLKRLIQNISRNQTTHVSIPTSKVSPVLPVSHVSPILKNHMRQKPTKKYTHVVRVEPLEPLERVVRVEPLEPLERVVTVEDVPEQLDFLIEAELQELNRVDFDSENDESDKTESKNVETTSVGEID